MCTVFAVCIDEISESCYQKLYKRMPDDRQLRTERYQHRADKMRSVAAFYALERALLWYYPNALDENKLQISYGKSGKPYLQALKTFHFSLSHAGKYAICAVNRKGSIGADILQIRKTDMRIAKRFFAKSEWDQLIQLQEGMEQDRLFSKIWTRKESFAKFTGDGLNIDLSEFSMDPDTKKVQTKEQRLPAHFVEMEEPDGYVICICCEAEISDKLMYHKIKMDKL